MTSWYESGGRIHAPSPVGIAQQASGRLTAATLTVRPSAPFFRGLAWGLVFAAVLWLLLSVAVWGVIA